MKYERTPYLVIFDETAAFKDTYSGQVGKVVLEAHLLKPETPSDTVVLFMHPIGGGAWLPLPSALAKTGTHVIYCNSRYRGIDNALIMEKCALDLGAAVRDAKERLGYKKVILGGWSGGGALSLFYQAEAENPTVTHTPAGDPLDLTAAGLIPVDGVALLAAHLSRNLTLTEWIDPSITDESRPFERDPELNIYDPANPNQAPYDPAYVERYRNAQIARNRRITAWVKERLAALRVAGKEKHEEGFVVHGTMADPRFLDETLEPSDRPPHWCFLGDPEVVNDGPVGLARFSTLRSWLSQWSYDDSNAHGLRCAARITVPLLVIENSADDACTPSHAGRLREAAVNAPQTHHVVKGANHYYFGQPEMAAEACEALNAWIATVPHRAAMLAL
ncbi:alpha/beta hydrolase [Novosphingobium mathurense]|uniref:Pimeloyl-ACP methyl ester carboxylesterase n=1 Tax=Novosphingobium mathurense TaxID=428990 RepID=A0A1U6HUV7_9SPHN|nr:alpha/beta fold hydrolase [Novosphingobium mathurense]SLJ99597.1 Pimeloyl-ACP methyl ester carboxylesterase [Novosphingobium mathurense]